MCWPYHLAATPAWPALSPVKIPLSNRSCLSFPISIVYRSLMCYVICNSSISFVQSYFVGTAVVLICFVWVLLPHPSFHVGSAVVAVAHTALLCRTAFVLSTFMIEQEIITATCSALLLPCFCSGSAFWLIVGSSKMSKATVGGRLQR